MIHGKHLHFEKGRIFHFTKTNMKEIMFVTKMIYRKQIQKKDRMINLGFSIT